MAVEVRVCVETSRLEVLIRRRDPLNLLRHLQQRVGGSVKLGEEAFDRSQSRIDDFVRPMPEPEEPPLTPFDLLDERRHVFGPPDSLQRPAGGFRGSEMQRAVRGGDGADEAGYRVRERGRSGEQDERRQRHAVIRVQDGETPETRQVQRVRSTARWVDDAHHHEEILVVGVLGRCGCELDTFPVAGGQSDHHRVGRHRAYDALIHHLRIAVIDVSAVEGRDGGGIAAHVSGKARKDHGYRGTGPSAGRNDETISGVARLKTVPLASNKHSRK